MSNPIPRLRRLLSIIPLIQRRGGISLQELQDTLGVSKRELQGDLNAIMLCGVPPYLPNDYISVFIDGDWVTVDYAQHFGRPANLTLPEALALRLAIARLQIPEDGELYEAYIELLEALDSLVLGEDMASLEGRIESVAGELSDTLGKLDVAIAERQQVTFTYYSPSSDTVAPRRVRPFGWGDRLGNQYLAAWCEEKQAKRSFRIDRISDLTILRDVPRFELPKDFDLNKWLSQIGSPKPSEATQVRVRFDKAIARYVEEEHAGRKVEHARAGDVVVDRAVCSLPWAVTWCLRYGERAELLEPAEGRSKVVERLKAYLGQPAVTK